MCRTHSLKVFGGRTLLNIGLPIALIVGASGCNLCCPPYMDDYATIGGKWQRSHPSEGIVGSRFSDPGVVHASTESMAYREGAYNYSGVYSEGEGSLFAPGSESSMNPTSSNGDFSDPPYDSIILLDE